MKFTKPEPKNMRLLLVPACLAALLLLSAYGKQPSVIKDVYVTAYYCPLNSEMKGQAVDIEIDGSNYAAKAPFLFGGRGVPMQGTGKLDNFGGSGIYLKYVCGSGGRFVRINRPEFTGKIRARYAALGITDFTGFGNMALSKPEEARFKEVSGVIGASGRVLKPWCSIAVDRSLIPLGATGKIVLGSGASVIEFSADDTGGGIKGNHIDIYVGEGQDALEMFGGNCTAEVCIVGS